MSLDFSNVDRAIHRIEWLLSQLQFAVDMEQRATSCAPSPQYIQSPQRHALAPRPKAKRPRPTKVKNCDPATREALGETYFRRDRWGEFVRGDVVRIQGHVIRRAADYHGAAHEDV